MLVNRQKYRFDRRAPDTASLVLDFEHDYARVNGNAARLENFVSIGRSSAGAGIDADGCLVSYPANTLRFNRRPGRGGLIVERGITNYLLFGSNPQASQWVKTNGTAFANNSYGIDGKMSAGFFQDTAAAGSTAGALSQTIGVAATAQWWTASIYVRQTIGTRLKAYIGITNGTSAVGGFVVFDTNVGAIISAQAGVVARIEQGPSGFMRLSLSVNNTVGQGALVFLLSRPTDADNPIGFYMANGQVNPGRSATSSLLTTTASVTRAPDIATVAITNDWFNQSFGTILVDATIAGAEDIDQTLASITGSPGTGTWITLQRHMTGQATINGVSVSGGVAAMFGSGAGATELPRRVRAALTYADGGTWLMAISGTQYEWTGAPFASGVITMTGPKTVPPNLRFIQIGHLEGTALLDGTVHRLAYIPAVLDAAELTALAS